MRTRFSSTSMLIACSGLLFAGAVASADQARFVISGEITAIHGPLPPPPGVMVGTPFEVAYLIDADAVDEDPEPNVGRYGVREFVLHIGPGVERILDRGSVSLLNNGFAGDSYGANNSLHPLTRVSISLVDFSGGVFDSDAQPRRLDLSDFEIADFSIEEDRGPSFWSASGAVRRIQILPVVTCNPDYNIDGGADNTDVIELAHDVASGTQTYPPNSPDFNQDGSIDLTDVFDLARVVAGEPCP